MTNTIPDTPGWFSSPVKPCCSLLSPWTPAATLEKLQGLGEKAQEFSLRDQGTGWVLFQHAPAAKGTFSRPLLGFPRWRLTIETSPLGTLVNFHWRAPWESLLAVAAPSFLPLILVPAGLPLNPWLWGVLALTWTGLQISSAWSTKTGRTFKALKELVRRELDGL